jgi:hypothetical protein
VLAAQDATPGLGEIECSCSTIVGRCPAMLMFETGQKWKCPGSRGTSVLPSGADIVSLLRHVRLVPRHKVAALQPAAREQEPERPVAS